MRPPERRSQLWPFILLAVLLHYVQFTFLPSLELETPAPEPEALNFEFGPEDVDQTALSEQRKQQQEEERKADRTPEGQVVEIPKPKAEQRPEKARFVSEYDQRVERETKAKSAAPGEKTAEPAPPPPSSVLTMRERSETTTGRTGLPVPPDSETGEGTATPGRPGEGSEKPGTPSLDQLRPSDEALARAIGRGASDYLADVEEGDETALNSRRWRFASFYNRVKRQVAENWHPEIAYRRRDPYGNVYGYRDRITVLRVSLWPDGSLKDLLLDQPSGVDFLDDEAMQSFRAAQPFLNPPNQLIDSESGLISFRFGFIFEINSQPTFRVFRYND